MTKEKKIKILKILSIVVWIILLMIPTIYGEIDVVTLTEEKTVINTDANRYEFTAVCDKEFVSGEAKINVYDSSEKKIKSLTIPFEDNEGKSITFKIDFEDVETAQGGIVIFEIEEMYVTTKQAEKLGNILYPIALAYVVWLIYIMSINAASYEHAGKKIEVYSGFAKHTLKIDGEVADTAKKVFFLKPIVLVAYIGEGLKIFAEIKANKRIIIYSQDAPIDGNVYAGEASQAAPATIQAETVADVKPQEKPVPVNVETTTSTDDPENEREENFIQQERVINEEVEELIENDDAEDDE